MKTSPALAFEHAMRQRGYSLDELAFCIVSRSAEEITFDETHPDFPRRPRQPIVLSSGPGTELKALLASFGIHASPTCQCNKMATQMDSWGPEESLKHIEQIVDVMQETAKARKLPFLRPVGRKLVRIACARARRKSAQTGH